MDKPSGGVVGAVRLALVCTLNLVLSGPMLVLPVLYRDMASSLGTSQAHVTALLPSAFAIGSLVLTMPGSLFMERFGLRLSFALGVFGQCLFTSMQAASGRLWQLVILQTALGACKCFAGPVGFIAFCNSWFGEQPSTAIAINLAAFGAAGTLWTPVAAVIASSFGWRAALTTVASVQWCITLPLAVCVVRDPPPSAPARRPSMVARDMQPDDTSAAVAWWLGDRSIWLLALFNFSELFVTFSVNNSVTLFLATDASMPLDRASLYTSLIFLCNMVAKLVSGPLYDGKHGGGCAATSCILLMVGTAILWQLARRPLLGSWAPVVFAFVFGIGYGSTYALVQTKAALHFGHRCGFKTLQGFLFCWQMAGTISGELLTPELAQTFSYSTAFGVLTGVATINLLAIVAFETREARICQNQARDLKATLL